MASSTDQKDEDYSFEKNKIIDNSFIFNQNDEEKKKVHYNQRAALFKKPISKDNIKLDVDLEESPQEIRRQRLLQIQKKNKNDVIDALRGLVQLVFDDEVEMEEENNSQNMEVDCVKHKMRITVKYGRMLMLSEWMLEVPEDFVDRWIMVPCPLGKRVIVIANKGFTNMYNRKGMKLAKFRTVLPGGSPNTSTNNCTILDCIWLADKKVLYVLDLLAWSNQEAYLYEAEFRFFWLKSRFEELNNPTERIKDVNDYPMFLLPTVSCNNDFYDCLESMSSTTPLDGVLFFHKESYYTCRQTPLVTWLKTYMLPEVFGMNVPESCEIKPDDYIDFNHHVQKVILDKKRISDLRNKKHKKVYEETMD